MVQIHACDVLEDLAKLRSLIIKKKKTNKQKTGKLSSFFGHNYFHIKPKKIIPKVEQSMWSHNAATRILGYIPKDLVL